MKKTIVVSAVNLVEGGPLTVLQECLRYLSANLSDKFEIIALVNNKTLFSYNNIKYLEFPKSKKSWINRLYYEYYYFSKLTKQFHAFLWLSLHDITPNVTTNRLVVYCHNASPFYRLSFKEAIMDPKFTLFNIFYKYLYRINIKKNSFVIVQQDWLRQEFIKTYKIKNVIVSYPKVNNGYLAQKQDKNIKVDTNFVFFYPAFPRVFKNFEVICNAVKILLDKGINSFEVYFTIDGTENKYARYIYKKFKCITNLKFLGLQSREKVYEIYSKTDCLLFPSKLETWGIPITEFKKFEKPILLPDLEYAHETIGDYERVIFFNPDDPLQLSDLMNNLMENKQAFETVKKKDIKYPFAASWEELFNILLKTELMRCTI